MTTVSPTRLEKEFYQAECKAWSPNGDSLIKYFVVTTPDRFRADIVNILQRKKSLFEVPGVKDSEKSRLEKKAKDLARQQNIILRAFESAEDSVTVETITSGQNYGIDLIKIPIKKRDIAQNTPFAKQVEPILIFRASSKNGARDAWEDLTRTDLDHLYEIGRNNTADEKSPSLTALENLFIESIDANELTRARKMLLPGVNESILALKAMRSALVYTFRKCGRFDAITKGELIKEPEEGRRYLDFINNLGIISASDFQQAVAVMAMANSATHHQVMDIHGMTTNVALHWSSEFIGKTIGYHRLDKSKAHGSIFADKFEVTLNEDEYLLRTSIHDQLQAHKSSRLNAAHSTDIYFSVDGKTEKMDSQSVMRNCVEIADALKKAIPNLTQNERRFLRIIDSYRNDCGTDYTPQDAIRACMFINGLMYVSKETASNLHTNLTPYQSEDPTLLLAVRRRGAAVTRFQKYNLNSIESILKDKTEIVRKIARNCPFDVLTPREWLVKEK